MGQSRKPEFLDLFHMTRPSMNSQLGPRSVFFLTLSRRVYYLPENFVSISHSWPFDPPSSVPAFSSWPCASNCLQMASFTVPRHLCVALYPFVRKEGKSRGPTTVRRSKCRRTSLHTYPLCHFFWIPPRRILHHGLTNTFFNSIDHDASTCSAFSCNHLSHATPTG
jgi:hypothetical protein